MAGQGGKRAKADTNIPAWQPDWWLRRVLRGTKARGEAERGRSEALAVTAHSTDARIGNNARGAQRSGQVNI